MSETRPDFSSTPGDEPSEVGNDRPGSYGTLHAEPLANGGLSAINTERTASDTPPDTEPFVADAEPADLDMNRTGSDSAPYRDAAALDTEPTAHDTEPAASDAELGTATAASDPADRGLDTEEPASGRAHLTLGEPVVARPDFAPDPSAVGGPAANGKPGADSDARWREIQAAFVDDPHGSVEQALQAVDDEVIALIGALRRRQEALAPVGQAAGQANVGLAADQPEVLAASPNPGDTERLRIALRDCRTFWADLAELGDRLG